MEYQENELAIAAARFVNSTGSHVFLTGKAGTGKTTFLKNLATRTHKSFVIVAPTGIAALNAGGVTIHSQFQLPLGTFLPDRTPSGSFNSENSIYTQYTLMRKHPISGPRRQVLRSIDLLIIDEVSMLRADVLDAIDYRLRSIRGNHHQSFGGVQVLMIGDLFQLPPIVKDHEWSYLRRYYHSAHFFEAKALQTDGYVFIELEKIFRQSDNTFIRILNNLRNNLTTAEDIHVLNQYYQPSDSSQIQDEIITITTHNYKAEELNRMALNRLPGKPFFYGASIKDDFPENIFPLPEKLELKVGAQIMFVKNDTSGQNKYFNGKLAKVAELYDDRIVVLLSGSNERLELALDLWENKKFSVNKSTKELDEEIIGTFQQFPVKLAWAVTVHKSQGLTFDKAIIDVGQAFAPGQVYVALSRLRSLDGLILRTKIDPKVISNDALVVQFSSRKNASESLDGTLKEKQRFYVADIIKDAFEFGLILKEFDKFIQDNDNDFEFEDESMKSTLQVVKNELLKEVENTQKFRYQLSQLLAQNEAQALQDRLNKGVDYYSDLLKKNIKTLILHASKASKFSGKKSYLNGIEELDQQLTKKLDAVVKCRYVVEAIINNQEWTGFEEVKRKRAQERIAWMNEIGLTLQQISPTSGKKSGRVKKGGKKAEPKEKKVSTVTESVNMFKSGMTIDQIAENRSLVPSTIESHLAKGVGAGTLEITDWLKQDEISEIQEVILKSENQTIAELYKLFDAKFSYGKLNAVTGYLKLKEPQ